MGARERRWLQFSIREILLVVTILVLIGGLWAQSLIHQQDLKQVNAQHRRDAFELRMTQNKWAHLVEYEWRELGNRQVAGKPMKEWGRLWGPDETTFGLKPTVLDPRCVMEIQPGTPPEAFEAVVQFAFSKAWPEAARTQTSLQRTIEPLLARYGEIDRPVDETLTLWQGGWEVHLKVGPGRNNTRVTVRQVNDPDWLRRHHGIDISGEEGILKKSEP